MTRGILGVAFLLKVPANVPRLGGRVRLRKVSAGLEPPADPGLLRAGVDCGPAEGENRRRVRLPHTPSKTVVDSLGAEALDGWTRCRLTGVPLERLAAS